MKRRRGLWLPTALCTVVAAGVVLAGRGTAQSQTPAAAPEAAKPDTADIGKPFKDFLLRDLAADPDDKAHATVKLSTYKGKKVVLGIFMANRCGTTWTYEAKIGKLLQDYGKKDVAIFAVHSNYVESDKEILGQMEQRNLAMPVLDDKPTQALADYLGATSTPTFFIIDKDGILRYKGAFDKFGDDTNPYVRPALDAVLAGKKVEVNTTRAFG
jgi:peroxiredoxin